jgi:hypothetical protein
MGRCVQAVGRRLQEVGAQGGWPVARVDGLMEGGTAATGRIRVDLAGLGIGEDVGARQEDLVQELRAQRPAHKISDETIWLTMGVSFCFIRLGNGLTPCHGDDTASFSSLNNLMPCQQKILCVLIINTMKPPL